MVGFIERFSDMVPACKFRVQGEPKAFDVICPIHVCMKEFFEGALYVQVTVHRDNLRTNNQQDTSSIQNFILSRNSTRFGHLLCPS